MSLADYCFFCTWVRERSCGRLEHCHDHCATAEERAPLEAWGQLPEPTRLSQMVSAIPVDPLRLLNFDKLIAGARPPYTVVPRGKRVWAHVPKADARPTELWPDLGRAKEEYGGVGEPPVCEPCGRSAAEVPDTDGVHECPGCGDTWWP